ncbi:hypothetical protein P7K49_039953 [Saguinus oedipus]|uniref:Uncharacterized protein n=1 Tax=Saguinus oedipus TaxID=9490 RepID=A0ABQ9TCG6_SAGOE|nr:hypothetical protein P7K49_039953 [Saguinus oedipus]
MQKQHSDLPFDSKVWYAIIMSFSSTFNVTYPELTYASGEARFTLSTDGGHVASFLAQCSASLADKSPRLLEYFSRLLPYLSLSQGLCAGAAPREVPAGLIKLQNSSSLKHESDKILFGNISIHLS